MATPDTLDSAAMSLYEGGRVSVRLVGHADKDVFLAWLGEMTAFDLAESPSIANDFDDSIDKQLNKRLTGIVVQRPNNRPIGYMQAYDINLLDGWCYVTSFISSEFRSQRFGVEATLGFWDYLFSTFHFRKIYFAVAAFNRNWLIELPLREIGLAEREAVFKSHLWRDDTWWDQEVFAIYRDRWSGLSQVLIPLARLGVPIGGRQSGAPLVPGNGTARPPRRSDTESAWSVVTEFLEHRLSGRAEEAICLLTEDVVYENPLFGVIKGKEAVGILVSFAAKVASQSATAGPRATWSTNSVGNHVSFVARREQLEYESSFEVSHRHICRIFDRGSPALFATYIGGDYPALS